MYNPILHELVAREQRDDQLRQAKLLGPENAGRARPRADRVDLRAYAGNLVVVVKQLLKAPARAD